MNKLPKDVVLVPSSHIELCGVIIPVGNAMFSGASMVDSRVRKDDEGKWVWRQDGKGLEHDPLPPWEWYPMPEAYHFTLLCGENGRWVELAIYPEQEYFAESMVYDLPGRPTRHSPDGSNDTAEQVLAVWYSECANPFPLMMDEYDDPFCGVEPGNWDPEFYD